MFTGIKRLHLEGYQRKSGNPFFGKISGLMDGAMYLWAKEYTANQHLVGPCLPFRGDSLFGEPGCFELSRLNMGPG